MRLIVSYPFLVSYYIVISNHTRAVIIAGVFVKLFLKFCKEHGNDIAMLCSKFQNDLTNEKKPWVKES